MQNWHQIYGLVAQMDIRLSYQKKHFHFHLFLLSFSKPIPFYLDVVLNVDFFIHSPEKATFRRLNVDFLYSIIWKSNMWGILYYLFPLLVDHLMLYLHVFINLLCGNMFLHNCLSSSITHIIMPQTIYIGSIYFLRQIFHFLYIYVLIFHIFGIMYQNSYW